MTEKRPNDTEIFKKIQETGEFIVKKVKSSILKTAFNVFYLRPFK
jgi:hypothetical protein